MADSNGMALVLVDKSEGVATLTLNNPDERNTLTAPMVAQILEAMDAFESDESVGALVVTGTPPAFCAGANRGNLAEATGESLGTIYEGFLRIAEDHVLEEMVKKLGAILVSSASSGGRALSILPHVHVVVADADQVVPDLGSALALAKARHGDQMPSMLSFITGPSRTGDIERILVLGAHGPKELYLVLVG